MATCSQPLLPNLDHINYSPDSALSLSSCASDEKYLNLLFEYFREDFVSVLRTAVCDFDKHPCKEHLASTIQGGYCYRIVKYDEGHSNAMYTLTFSLDNMRKERVNWRKTERLKNSTLIVLQNDGDPPSRYYATVLRCNDQVERNAKTNTVSVKMLDGIGITRRLTWAIEPSAYYEAYRPVLERLKVMAAIGGTLPFSRYIVRGEIDTKPPQYLRKFDHFIVGGHERSPGWIRQYGVPGLMLDSSQKESLYKALTSELALIEGPPGTGKTFIGVQVIKILMENKVIWSRDGVGSICLMAYTNHAIDNFVSQCIDAGVNCDKLVRLGYGFKPALQQYSMRNKTAELKAKHRNIQQLDSDVQRLKDDERRLKDKIGRFDRNPDFIDYCAVIDAVHVEQLKRLSATVKHSDVCTWVYSRPSEYLTELDDFMSRNEAMRVMNIFAISQSDRARLASYWIKRARKHAMQEMGQLQTRIEDQMRQLQIAVVQQCDIIAMTTTGASKYTHLIDAAKTEIMLVEEAAQIIEAHTIAPLTSSCKHLILLGDHWQLKPNTSLYVSDQYGLNVSLFERMIEGDLPSVQLELQYRMHPDIASILVPNIYPSLDSHHSVSEYPAVRGLAHRAMFICHENEETKEDETKSRSNQFEAEFMSKLCRYLLQQGYQNTEITILSLYSDQVSAILKELKEIDISGVRVCTVDAHQGEQNYIILVSFVCSSQNSAFLDPHRVSAALSCAKHGFYAIGNFAAYAQQKFVQSRFRQRRMGRVNYTDLWGELYTQWSSEGKAMNYLTLQCSNHPNITTKVFDPEHFDTYAIDGGCNSVCGYEVCMHGACTKTCHRDDVDHSLCDIMMTIVPGDGDVRQRYCYQLNKYPWNGDEKLEILCKQCSQKSLYPYTQRTFKCEAPNNVRLRCGHVKILPCFDSKKPEIIRQAELICGEMVTKIFQTCAHKFSLKCKMSKTFTCNKDIELQLDCGHKRRIRCVDKNLPEYKLCIENINLKLTCGHEKAIPCVQKNQMNAKQCVESVKLKLICGHENRVLCCHKDNLWSSFCDIVLYKGLPCGHTIRYMCGKRADIEKPTYKCEEKVTKTRDCGHVISRQPCCKILSILQEPCRENVNETVALIFPKNTPCHEYTRRQKEMKNNPNEKNCLIS